MEELIMARRRVQLQEADLAARPVLVQLRDAAIRLMLPYL